MERRQLESTAADYPYLQGLWMIPLGIGIIVAGVSNLQSRPTGIGALALILGGLAIAGSASLLIARYYRDHYGSVTPTRDRTIRQAVAIVAWIAILFVGANQALFWAPDGPSASTPRPSRSRPWPITRSSSACGRTTSSSGVLSSWPGSSPIWGGLGVDRDPLAMIPLGLAAMISGLLDQRVLARSLAVPTGDRLEGSRVGR